MSRNRTNYNPTRNTYVYGSAARRLEPQRYPEVPHRRAIQEVRKNRERARHMSAGYVLFLATALCAAALVLVNYIQLQSELTSRTKSVAAKESELNSLRIANDEFYNKTVNSVSLEDVKRIAIGELGMVYAEDGQIITYTGSQNDYMRQVANESQKK